MLFFDAIAENRKNTVLLISVFLALLLGLGYLFGASYGDASIGILFALVFALITILPSYYAGDKLLLAMSAAHPVEKKDNPQLYNVVEELSIAAGIPMPKIYIINDTAPNAFATGRNAKVASVAITQGLLEKLNRDELQGVVAHELSHIRNHDILYSTLIALLVGTIALLCDFFFRSFRYGRRSRSGERSGQGSAIFFIVAIALAIFAPFFAQILQFAVSRQREYLADASGAALTRYPEGLASALEKISKDKEVLEVANRATQHLYIVNPIKPFESRAQNNIFSTHPPLEERIKRLRAM